MDEKIKVSGNGGEVIMKIEDEEGTLTATMDKMAAVRLAAELLHYAYNRD